MFRKSEETSTGAIAPVTSYLAAECSRLSPAKRVSRPTQAALDETLKAFKISGILAMNFQTPLW